MCWRLNKCWKQNPEENLVSQLPRPCVTTHILIMCKPVHTLISFNCILPCTWDEAAIPIRQMRESMICSRSKVAQRV